MLNKHAKCYYLIETTALGITTHFVINLTVQIRCGCSIKVPNLPRKLRPLTSQMWTP